ncbi:MAG: 2-amino-4-hydroxy-6-hydroxymethyldihydropteridine diphosphokinase [Gemmatimonadota bacterium]
MVGPRGRRRRPTIPTRPESVGEGLEAVPFVLALGSNLGDRRGHLDAGLRYLSERLQIERVSSIVESEPWGPVSQPHYLNLVLRGHGAESPTGLLRIAQGAEAEAGRVRDLRYGPRTLDVDIVFFGDLVLETPSLTIPHPRWEERPFVRDLLKEVADDLVDPRSGRSLGELDELPAAEQEGES